MLKDIKKYKTETLQKKLTAINEKIAETIAKFTNSVYWGCDLSRKKSNNYNFEELSDTRNQIEKELEKRKRESINE
jgi:hypothetical protein